MDDTYVYIAVKLYLNDGQTEDSIQEVIQEVDYSFNHDEIYDHEIVDIIDMQIPEDSDDISALIQPLEGDYVCWAGNHCEIEREQQIKPEDIGGLPIVVDPFGLPIEGE